MTKLQRLRGILDVYERELKDLYEQSKEYQKKYDSCSQFYAYEMGNQAGLEQALSYIQAIKRAVGDK